MSKSIENLTLDEIEDRISSIAKADGNGWKLAFTLMEKVEIEEMWRKTDASSFSDWLESFALRESLSIHSLWKARKAGSCYRRYEASMLSSGVNKHEIVKFEDTTIPEDTLIYLDRMSFGDDITRQKLYSYATKHRVTAKNAFKAYESMKLKMEKAGIEVMRHNANVPYPSVPDDLDAEEILSSHVYPEANDGTLTDAQIVFLVHKHMGARVSKAALENALSRYSMSL